MKDMRKAYGYIKVLAVMSACFLLITGCGGKAETSEAVEIPDENLRTALCEAAGLEEGAELTKKDLEKVETLTLQLVGNLDGIQNCVNLRELTIEEWSGDEIDASFVKGLNKLEIFTARTSPIKDLSAFQDMASLKELVIWVDEVIDFSPLYGKSFDFLGIDFEGIENLEIDAEGNITSDGEQWETVEQFVQNILGAEEAVE